MFNKKKPILTKEQELRIKARMELNKRIKKVNNLIGELLAKEGMTLIVEHQIKIVPMKPRIQPNK